MSRKANDGRGRLGGRKKGTPNKTPVELREWVKNLIFKNRDKVESDFDKLTPKERLQMIEKLLPYILPKQQAVSASVNLNSLEEEQLDTLISDITNNINL